MDKPVLHLSHLREGVYTYELVVTDTKGQSASAEVHVYVKASHNNAPVAGVEFNVTTVEPGDVVVLNGEPSTDDLLVSKYQWTQVRCVFTNAGRCPLSLIAFYIALYMNEMYEKVCCIIINIIGS